MSSSTFENTPEMDTFGQLEMSPVPPMQHPAGVKTPDGWPIEPTPTATQGIKLDQHKPRTDLITWEGLDMIRQHIWDAATKDVENYTAGLPHMSAWWARGEGHNLEHAAARVFVKLNQILTGNTPLREYGPYMGRVPVALLAVGQVLAFGAKKYAARNWEKGILYSRVYAAAQRHLLAHLSGETKDPETGLPHLAHAACCLMFLLTFEARGMGATLDDRPKSQDIKK